MKIVTGSIRVLDVRPKKKNDNLEENVIKSGSDGEFICSICITNVFSKADLIHCSSEKCRAASHLICLADKFLEGEKDKMLPVQGLCPVCGQMQLWAELVRLKNIEDGDNCSDDEDDEDDLGVLTQQPTP